MELQVRRWGNSLATRFPVDLLAHLGVAEGDSLDVQLADDGSVCLRAKPRSIDSVLAGIAARVDAMPATSEVVRELREGARY